jgi:hypothetical protein
VVDASLKDHEVRLLVSDLHAEIEMVAEQRDMIATEAERLRNALAHIANVRHWLNDDSDERVAYLQRVAREALSA